MVTLSAAQTGQHIDDSDIQTWNEFQLSAPLHKKIDLYFAGTLWLGKNASRSQEERMAVGLTYKLSHRYSVTPFVSIMRSRNLAGIYQSEERLQLRQILKFPFKKIGLALRSNYEYRIRSVGNSWRLGSAAIIDRKIEPAGIQGLKLFVFEEPFYDSASGRFSRNRFSAGLNKILNKKLSIDLYYLRQDDHFTHPSLIHAIGATWKIAL
jgi:hypothetical protein